MAKQTKDHGYTGAWTLRDRIAMGVLVLVPVAMAVAVAVTFAMHEPDDALAEMFVSGLVLWPM